MNKPELLNWLKEEQQKWELLIAAIGESIWSNPANRFMVGVRGQSD